MTMREGSAGRGKGCEREAADDLKRDAAPEMYEALKLAKKELQASGNWSAKDFGWQQVRAHITAALAKAEGIA